MLLHPPAGRRSLIALVSLVIVGGGLGVLWSSIHPTNARTWIAEQAVLPQAEFDGDRVRISGLRNFEYTARQDFTPRYEDRTYDLTKLTSVWYVLTPFSRQWRGPAHSFVSFGFADSQFVSISVEARREPGEVYDAIKGIFKRFELMYVIGDERDLIGQRAAFDDDRVYLYPVRAEPEKMREMFVAMLQRANSLRERPEFYNTLSNNCTNNIVRHVNSISPNTVPGGIKTILPGYTDEVAHRLGLIDSDIDLETTRERFLINERARRYITHPAFSFLIRQSHEGTVSTR